jgi:hypothetical protein
LVQLVKNTISGNLTDIDKAQMIGIKPGPIFTGVNGFAVVCYHQPGIGYKLAEFNTEDDARACLDKIQKFKIDGFENLIEIEDIVVASLLELPTDAKGKGSLIKV